MTRLRAAIRIVKSREPIVLRIAMGGQNACPGTMEQPTCPPRSGKALKEFFRRPYEPPLVVDPSLLRRYCNNPHCPNELCCAQGRHHGPSAFGDPQCERHADIG